MTGQPPRREAGRIHAGGLVLTGYWWKVEMLFPSKIVFTVRGTSSKKQEGFHPFVIAGTSPHRSLVTPTSMFSLSLNCLSKKLLTNFESVGFVGHTKQGFRS